MLNLIINSMENPYGKILRLAILSPIGILGVGFLFLGSAGIFLYGLLIAYRPNLIFQWQSWVYPLIFLSIASILISFSLLSIRRGAIKFINEVKEKEKDLQKYTINNDIDIINEESSEFGINSRDIEILKMIWDSGGFIPILKQQIFDSPFSMDEAIISLAKLAILEYIHISNEKMKLNITITPQGLDALELPKITFTSLVPWDISLMIIKANLLYREGNYDKVILSVYNTLERAFKAHLIPSIDDYREKWNENIKKKFGNDEKSIKLYEWAGIKTIASLNALWNFYKKEANIGRKWEGLIDREVKYLEEERRMIDKIIDTIADTRSKYAHNKPGRKYVKDAYRLLKLTEIVIGVLFEDLKNRIMEN